MSIIGDKYAGKYRGDGDWLTSLINDTCYVQETKEVDVKDEDGNVTGTETVNKGKPRLDLDALFALAEANGINATEKYGDQADKRNAPGRLRMTLGNSLRAVARRRGGLWKNGSEFLSAPKDFMGDRVPTETPEGEKIAKAKDDEAEAA